MTRRRLHRDDRAVSSVVAAVLLFALFSTAFLTWTVMTLPQWVADNEATHEDQVIDVFTALQAGLDRLSASESTGTTTGAFQLGAEAVPLLQGTPSRGTIEATDGFRVQATFTDPALHLVDGSVAGAPSEPADGPAVTGIGSLSVLQVALSSTTSNNGAAWVEVEADDGTDTVTARLTHWGRNNAPTCDSAELELSIASPLGSDDYLIACIGDTLPSYTLDLLSSTYPFRSGLAQLEAPYTLTVTDDATGGGGPSAAGTYLAVYQDTDGFTRLVGDGQASPGFGLDESGDRLRFTPDRQEYVPQTLSWEGGALAVNQSGVGAALAMDPGFSLHVSGTTGFLRWTLVDLDASGSLSGSGKAAATVTHLGTTSFLLSADAADLTVSSDVAPAWQGFFDDRITAAGTADVTTTAGAGNVTVSLGQGTVTEWIVQVRIIHAQASIQ